MTTSVLTLAKNPVIGGNKKVADLLTDFDAVLRAQNAYARQETVKLEQRLAAEGFSDPSRMLTPVEPAKVSLKSKINGAFVTVCVNEKGKKALEQSGMFLINPAVRTCALRGYVHEV